MKHLQNIENKVDLQIASQHFLLGMVFPKSRSKTYATALEVCKKAAYYFEKEIAGEKWHLVLFGKDRDDAIRARSMVTFAGNWKGTEIFSGGSPIILPYHIAHVLDCYIQAMAAPDQKAHCVVRFNESTVKLEDRKHGPYFYPCRHMSGFIFQDISLDHPSSLVDQFKAAAVRHNCHWCPLLAPEKLTKMPRENTMQDTMESFNQMIQEDFVDTIMAGPEDGEQVH